MEPVHLHKLHATGNDFLVVVDLADTLGDRLDAVSLCDRHRGIGADGLIRILAGRDGCELAMILTNADGGRAEMSGNGVRALASVAVAEGLVAGRRFRLATDAGPRTVTVECDDAGRAVAARLDMGPARFGVSDVEVAVEGGGGSPSACYVGDEVDMGNPHFVVFVDDPDAVALVAHGPLIEHHPRFPRRTNVHFVRATGADRLHMVIWERGAGATLSCGTGACAAVAAAHRRGLVGPQVAVEVPGGILEVTMAEATIVLGGPVAPVFEVDVVPEHLVASGTRARTGRR